MSNDPVTTAPGAITALKPPLKWAGGKRWLVPYLSNIWQEHKHRRFVEPFCGGLAMALGLNPERALLNDINPHLINFYNWLKRGLRISVKMVNEKHYFYCCRSRFNELLRSNNIRTKEAASLFYYLNRTGYNGLCRFNRRGEFNVPFGRHKIIYRYDFMAYKAAFSEWEFAQTTFDQLSLKPKDFVYADPPYDVEFTDYSQDGFNWEEQVRTAKWLSRHKGPVVLSNQATKDILELYKGLGFEIIRLDAPRRISRTGDRKPAQEVLALKNLTVIAKKRGLFY